MKFRWKLMIITMLIVSFSFGFGGMLLIQYSYQASIKQEKRAARNSYEMILRMLKEINEKYGITIVIITHEMAVVREICNRVGIVGGGHLVETGEVLEVFSHPQSKEARELVIRSASENAELVDELQTKNCVRIVFSANSSFEPVIANMVLRFQTPVNILRADTKNVSGIAHGEMILGLPEDKKISHEMIQYLKDRNLAVEEVSDYVG